MAPSCHPILTGQFSATDTDSYVFATPSSSYRRLEGGVMLDNASRHQPDHPSEMPVARLDILLDPSNLPD